METLLSLDQIGNRYAVHISGRYFVDAGKVIRRYGVIEVSGGGDRDSLDVEVERYSVIPQAFPRDSWILLG
jgi:hypothetical protein